MRIHIFLIFRLLIHHSPQGHESAVGDVDIKLHFLGLHFVSFLFPSTLLVELLSITVYSTFFSTYASFKFLLRFFFLTRNPHLLVF